MKKYLSLCLFFFILFSLSLTSWVFPENIFSDRENRYLERKPEWSFASLINGGYTQRFEAYVSDQFPFRTGWLQAKAMAESIQGKRENNGVVVGKDGHLFNKYLALGKDFVPNVKMIQRFAQNNHVPITFLLAPNGYEVLRDKVPYGLYNVKQEEWFQWIEKQMGDVFLDVRPHMNGAHPLYYRLDHHWTTYGAFQAYEAVALAKGFKPLVYESIEFVQVPEFYGTFHASLNRSLGEGDVIEVPQIPGLELYIDGVKMPSIYDMNHANGRDKYGLFLHNNPGRATLIGSEPQGERLLVFKDSYANSLLPFLATHYQSIEIIDLRHYTGSVSRLMDEKWDQVLFLYNFISFSEDRHVSKLAY